MTIKMTACFYSIAVLAIIPMQARDISQEMILIFFSNLQRCNVQEVRTMLHEHPALASAIRVNETRTPILCCKALTPRCIACEERAFEAIFGDISAINYALYHYHRLKDQCAREIAETLARYLKLDAEKLLEDNGCGVYNREHENLLVEKGRLDPYEFSKRVACHYHNKKRSATGPMVMSM